MTLGSTGFGSLRNIRRQRTRVRPLSGSALGGGEPAIGGTDASSATPPGSADQSQFDTAQGFFLGLAGELGSTFSQETLRGFEPKLNAEGIELLVSGSGITQKIRLPNGEVVDVIGGATAGGGTGTLQFDATGDIVDSPSGGQFAAGGIFGATTETGDPNVLGGQAQARPRTSGDQAQPRDTVLGGRPVRRRSPVGVA